MYVPTYSPGHVAELPIVYTCPVPHKPTSKPLGHDMSVSAELEVRQMR